MYHSKGNRTWRTHFRCFIEIVLACFLGIAKASAYWLRPPLITNRRCFACLPRLEPRRLFPSRPLCWWSEDSWRNCSKNDIWLLGRCTEKECKSYDNRDSQCQCYAYGNEITITSFTKCILKDNVQNIIHACVVNGRLLRPKSIEGLFPVCLCLGSHRYPLLRNINHLWLLLSLGWLLGSKVIWRGKSHSPLKLSIAGTRTKGLLLDTLAPHSEFQHFLDAKTYQMEVNDIPNL